MPEQEFEPQGGQQQAEPSAQVGEAAEASATAPPSLEGGEATGAGAEAAPSGMKWYIIHTYSGFEQKVAESLRARAEAYGFSHKIGQILIPTEEVVELRNGKKVTSKRLLYPGYVMVQVAMDDDLWHHIKNTPRVT
ncbi:MAG: hypothetical protein K6T68_12645, partial [Alicyclobacillus shizuokensis]|nr:hypothetical protein [Alicyclobacillus shizuokensis]